jgi:mono/diheme cytochrome c family protein
MRHWIQLSVVLTLLLSLIGVVGLVAACGGSQSDTRERQPQEMQADEHSGPRTGEHIFASTCAVCHGTGGEGDDNWMVRDEDGRLPPPPLNGDGHTWHHSDGVLYGIVSNGGAGIGFGSNMPAFKDELTHEEIIAVLEFVKTWWDGKEIDGFPLRESQQELSQADPYPPSGG